MKKKYVALMAGVGAAMAIGAPMAMAAPEVPSLPGFPGAEPNGADCSFEAGSGTAESNVPAFTPPALPALPDTNQGNCQSFGNDQHNGEYSDGEYVYPQVPVQDENSNGGLSGGTFEGGDVPNP